MTERQNAFHEWWLKGESIIDFHFQGTCDPQSKQTLSVSGFKKKICYGKNINNKFPTLFFDKKVKIVGKHHVTLLNKTGDANLSSVITKEQYAKNLFEFFQKTQRDILIHKKRCFLDEEASVEAARRDHDYECGKSHSLVYSLDIIHFCLDLADRAGINLYWDGPLYNTTCQKKCKYYSYLIFSIVDRIISDFEITEPEDGPNPIRFDMTDDRLILFQVLTVYTMIVVSSHVTKVTLDIVAIDLNDVTPEEKDYGCFSANYDDEIRLSWLKVQGIFLVLVNNACGYGLFKSLDELNYVNEAEKYSPQSIRESKPQLVGGLNGRTYGTLKALSIRKVLDVHKKVQKYDSKSVIFKGGVTVSAVDIDDMITNVDPILNFYGSDFQLNGFVHFWMCPFIEHQNSHYTFSRLSRHKFDGNLTCDCGSSGECRWETERCIKKKYKKTYLHIDFVMIMEREEIMREIWDDDEDNYLNEYNCETYANTDISYLVSHYNYSPTLYNENGCYDPGCSCAEGRKFCAKRFFRTYF